MTIDLERLRTLAAHRAKFLGFGTAPEDLEEWQAAEEIEELQKDLAACRAARDRLARQVDGYKQAGKTTLDKFVGRKKT